MELIISPKGNKFQVTDKGQERLIYTIKKKGLGSGKYVLLDPSNYQLYAFMQVEEDHKPRFIISHNGSAMLHITCKSLFLDPTLTVEGRDLSGQQINYSIASKDRRDFRLIKDGEEVGSLTTKVSMSNEAQYDLIINDKFFDDYIAFFAVAVEMTFGGKNRS